jgi:hypothetical protein
MDVSMRLISRKSTWLKETVSEFDPSCENVTFTAKPRDPSSKEPCLSFRAVGNHGSAQVSAIIAGCASELV